MKRKLAKFILYIYLNHIQEDFDIYKPVLRFFIYLAWFIRSIIVWLLCPLFIPEYLFKQSKVYAIFQEQGSAPTPEQLKQLNKTNTQRFLNRKKR